MREENRELLRVMQELRERQEDLARLNEELENTNRGVVASVRGTGRKSGAAAPRRPDEIAVLVPHEPRVPDAPHLDPGV